MGVMLSTPSRAVAEDDMPTGGVDSGMGPGLANDLDTQRSMDDLRLHSIVMEGITDTKKVIDKIRKHMRMLDHLVAEMVRGQAHTAVAEWVASR